MGMLKKYLRDSSGQFAIMFSVCATVLVVGVAASIDLMGIQKQKAQLQSLTDAAVLAAAGTKSENQAELRKIAQATIDANNPSGENINIKLSVVDDIITVAGGTVYDTQLMGIMGMDKIDIAAQSSAPIPKDIPINIALVLDRTGSMSGANMDSLKSASGKLIEMFSEFDGEVKAGVVPFSNYVNVGLANRDAKWMNVPTDSSVVGTESCYMTRDLVDSSQCQSTEYAGSCSNGDGGTYSCTKTSTSCPDSAYGPEYETCNTPTTNVTWNGCAGSRDNDRHKEPAYNAKAIPGVMNARCGEEILPLTNDIDQVKNKINSLSASGKTYIPAGLIWGWRLLDPKAPFDDLSNGQDKRKRALILMTDGANTLSLTQPTHEGSDPDKADELTTELCADIKKDGVEVFTVAYKLSSSLAKTKDIIRECASSDELFFDASNTAELEQAFEEIGRSLYEVRLSQ